MNCSFRATSFNNIILCHGMPLLCTMALTVYLIVMFALLPNLVLCSVFPHRKREPTQVALMGPSLMATSMTRSTLAVARYVTQLPHYCLVTIVLLKRLSLLMIKHDKNEEHVHVRFCWSGLEEKEGPPSPSPSLML